MPLDGTATSIPNHVHHQCLIAGFSFSFQSHPEPVDEKAVDAAAQTPTQMDPRCRTVDVEKVRAGDFSGMLFAGALLGETRSPLPHMSAGFLLTPGMGGDARREPIWLLLSLLPEQTASLMLYCRGVAALGGSCGIDMGGDGFL